MARAPRRSAGRPRFGSLVSGRPLKTAASGQHAVKADVPHSIRKSPNLGGWSTRNTVGPPQWAEEAGPARREFPWPQRDGIAARQEPADQHQVPLVPKKARPFRQGACAVSRLNGARLADTAAANLGHSFLSSQGHQRIASSCEQPGYSTSGRQRPAGGNYWCLPDWTDPLDRH